MKASIFDVIKEVRNARIYRNEKTIIHSIKCFVGQVGLFKSHQWVDGPLAGPVLYYLETKPGIENEELEEILKGVPADMFFRYNAFFVLRKMDRFGQVCERQLRSILLSMGGTTLRGKSLQEGPIAHAE